MNENANQRLNEGHRHIVEFLEQWQERITFSTNYHDKQKKLLEIAMGFGLKPAKGIVETLKKDVGKTYQDRSKVISSLNESLRKFSIKYCISPPIQFYLISAKLHDQIMHFACCRDKIKGGSADYVSVDYLHKTLSNASEVLLTEEDEQKNLYSDNKIIEGKIKEWLTEDALQHLREKLEPKNENDYQPLDIQHGLIDYQQKGSNLNYDGLRDVLLGHGRKWYSFDAFEFFKPFGAYILSSEVGTGKTTFLRYLQWQMLKQDLLPLFVHASQLEKWGVESFSEFAKKYAQVFPSKLKQEQVVLCLEGALKEGILVLLVDGLDQIDGVGTEYENMINIIIKISNTNLIIGSRPTAAISQDSNSEFTFLRLEPFDMDAQKQYFGKHYKRACQLAVHAPKLVSVPMLAYMLRILIEKKQDKNIINRTGLYKRFINYILKEYKHEKTKLSKDAQVKTIQSLRRMSYDALARKNFYTQKIPLEFCYEEPNRLLVRSDDLTKYGLVNLIIERACGIDDFLCFTHQSFQEYLAAEWADNNNDGLKTIINEILNPKWKEVIRFFAGIRGEEFVKQIYSQRGHDNQTLSYLFLAAECCCELSDSQEFKKKLLAELVDLLKVQEFAENAIVAIAKIDIPEAVDTLLRLIEKICRGFKLELVTNLQKLAIESIRAVSTRLTQAQKDRFLRHAATSGYPFAQLFDGVIEAMLQENVINNQDVDQVFDYICHAGIALLDKEALSTLSKAANQSSVLKVLNITVGLKAMYRPRVLSVLCCLAEKGKLEDQNIQALYHLLKDSSIEGKKQILHIFENTISKEILTSGNVDILLGLLQEDYKYLRLYAARLLRDWFNVRLSIHYSYIFSTKQRNEVLSTIKKSNKKVRRDAVCIFAGICKQYGYNYISDIMNLLTKSENNLQIIILKAMRQLAEQTAVNETYSFVKPYVNDVFQLVQSKNHNLTRAVWFLLSYYKKELSSEYPGIVSWLDKSG